MSGELSQLRLVDTPAGPITYTLTRKRVKNLNLRVGRDGTGRYPCLSRPGAP